MNNINSMNNINTMNNMTDYQKNQERLSRLQYDANQLIQEQNALRKQLSIFFGEGEGGGEEEQKQGDLTPEEDLNQFLNQHSEFQTLFKMLKVGVPIIGAKQKAQLNGLDMDLFNEMIEKAQKVHPNIN